MSLIVTLINLYALIVLLSLFLSLARPDPRSSIVILVRGLTEPALEPVRRVLPPAGGIDLSPTLLLMLLLLVRWML